MAILRNFQARKKFQIIEFILECWLQAWKVINWKGLSRDSKLKSLRYEYLQIFTQKSWFTRLLVTVNGFGSFQRLLEPFSGFWEISVGYEKQQMHQ